MKKGYVSVSEGQIHYREEGSGEPLILFHQAPLSSFEFNDVIPLLSEHFRVICPDMIGHGESSDPPREYEMEDFTRVTLQFLDSLGIKQAFVGGNHSGSALALSVYLTRPQLVKKLILSCETLMDKAQIQAFLDQLKSRPMSRDLPMDEAGKFLAEAWDRYRALAPDAPLPVRFKPFIIGLAARQRPFDVHYAVFRWMAREDRARKIKCSTLVYGAERDIFFTMKLMDDIKQHIPTSQTAVIKDAGAMVLFQNPKKWAEVVLRFLK